jgi:hypothetical protein
MRSHARPPRVRDLVVVLVLLLAVVAVGVEGATIPHAHRSATPGLFNQEHDLTSLATSRGVTMPDAAPAITLTVVVAAFVPCTAARPIATPSRPFDSRAPPAPRA